MITLKQKKVDREGAQQKLLFQWLKWAHPRAYELAFHVPNGGKRNAITAAKLKAEGVKAGVPDIMIALPNREFAGLFIEFKAAKPHSAAVSVHQKAWLQNLNTAGYLAVVCRGMDEAKTAIDGYLAGVNINDNGGAK